MKGEPYATRPRPAFCGQTPKFMEASAMILITGATGTNGRLVVEGVRALDGIVLGPDWLD